VNGVKPLRAPKPSFLTFLTVISMISPSLIFLLSTSSLGRVTTREPPTFRVFARPVGITTIILNDTGVIFNSSAGLGGRFEEES